MRNRTHRHSNPANTRTHSQWLPLELPQCIPTHTHIQWLPHRCHTAAYTLSLPHILLQPATHTHTRPHAALACIHTHTLKQPHIVIATITTTATAKHTRTHTHLAVHCHAAPALHNPAYTQSVTLMHTTATILPLSHCHCHNKKLHVRTRHNS